MTTVRSLIFSAALLAAGCASIACNEKKQAAPAVAPLAAEASHPGDLPPDTVVALMGSEKITAAQLDEKLKPQLQQLDEKYQKDRFDMKRQGLEQWVVEQLVQKEAAKKGMTEEQYFKAEVEDKIPAPSDAEVKAKWAEIQAKIGDKLPPGASFEQFRSRIVEDMTNEPRRQRIKMLIDGLKAQANVQIKLSEPRKVVDAKGPSRGPTDAKVTIVEFSDFQCPYCGRAHDTVEEVMKAYAGKVRLVFRHYPLDFHPFAAKAAEAAACANEQGKFWEYYDVLFANQNKLEVPQLKEHAASVGMDASRFAECLDSGKQAALVRADQQAGQKLGVTGTPAFFINGVEMAGALPLDDFKRVIDEELAN